MRMIKVPSTEYRIGEKEDELISYGFARCSPVVLRTKKKAGLLHWNCIERCKSAFKLIYMVRDMMDVADAYLEAIIANKYNQLNEIRDIIKGIDCIAEPEFTMGNMVFEFSKKPRINIVEEYTPKNFNFPNIYKVIYSVKNRSFRIEDCIRDNF